MIHGADGETPVGLKEGSRQIADAPAFCLHAHDEPLMYVIVEGSRDASRQSPAVSAQRIQFSK